MNIKCFNLNKKYIYIQLYSKFEIKQFKSFLCICLYTWVYLWPIWPAHQIYLLEVKYNPNQSNTLCYGIVYIFLQEDLYYPHPVIQDIIWATIDKIVEPILMRWPGKKLREKALSRVMEHIHYEDENTRYVCIGSVNKVSSSFVKFVPMDCICSLRLLRETSILQALNMLCCWVEDSNSDAFKFHLPRIHDYLWVAEDGMKMKVYMILHFILAVLYHI